jgi:transcription initiation factor IIE alpha subunit
MSSSFPLEELVRAVAYMFYDDQHTMVLMGLLEIGEPIPIDDLSDRLKFRKSDLGKALGRLRQDGLIAVEQRLFLPNGEDPDALTEHQRLRLMRDYYSLDFKSLVDSVHLKIHLVRQQLSTECGPEDAIFYACPRCRAEDGGCGGRRRRFVYRLLELLAANDGESELACPACASPLDELDDSAEVHAKKRACRLFVELTDPLLALIQHTRGHVMIDDPEMRCKADQMMPIDEYNEERAKIRDEKERRRQIRRDYSAAAASAAFHAGAAQNVAVAVVMKQPLAAQPQREIGREEQELLKREDRAAAEREKAKATIVIGGREYTADQITSDVTNAITDDEEFDRVMSFVIQNK